MSDATPLPKMTAVWDGGLRFVHTSASGHELVTDAPLASGGTDTAPSPMELVLLGVIGCTGVDVQEFPHKFVTKSYKSLVYNG